MAKNKKDRNKMKVVEKSTSEKVNFYKGETRTLRRRIDNLEKRIAQMEERMNKYKKLIPDEPLNFGMSPKVKKEKKAKEFKKKFMEEHYPKKEEE